MKQKNTIFNYITPAKKKMKIDENVDVLDSEPTHDTSSSYKNENVSSEKVGNLENESVDKVDGESDVVQIRHSRPNCSQAWDNQTLSAIDEPRRLPPKDFDFPSTAFGKRLRSFSYHYLNKFTFLEYCTTKDALFCKTCRHFNNEVRT